MVLREKITAQILYYAQNTIVPNAITLFLRNVIVACLSVATFLSDYKGKDHLK